MDIIKRVGIAVLAAVAVSAHGAEPDGWVADPYRATGAKWKKHVIKGRDFWHFLKSDWLSLDGVKDLPMVRDAATQWVKSDKSSAVVGFTRRICVKGVAAKDAEGKEVPSTFEISCDEPGATVDKGDGFVVLSAPFCDVKVRYLPARGRLVVRAERPVKCVEIAHGSPRGAVIADVERTSVPAEIALSDRKCVLELATPARELTLDIASDKPGMTMYGIAGEAALRERLERAPFTMLPPSSIWGAIGAPEGFIDNREAMRAIRERYPETFLGIEITEWDANFLQTINHGTTGPALRDLMQVREIPTDRNGMVNNMALQWNNYARLFGDRLSAMSGGINFQLLSGDFGANVICTELSGERVSKPQRLEQMYTVSAARQFGVPASIYIAYFCAAQHPDSRLVYKRLGPKFTDRGRDWGQAPSLTTRNFYPFYYLGGNFISFESQPHGQAEPIDEDEKTWRLTGNGKAIEDLYGWYRGEKGERGEGYAPILLLEDRRAGDDQAWPLATRQASFYGMFDATDGDVMTEYIMRAIASANGHESPTDPAGGSCHFNSSLGNVFNMAIANPLRSPEISAEHLAKYAVVVVAGDLVWSETIANRVKRYVAGGGTLVITAGQSHPFDAAFLGAEADAKDVIEADGLLVCRAKLRNGAKVLKATSTGLPLVVANRYGAGQVDFVLSPFFRKALAANAKPEDRFVAPPQVKELLESVQDFVLPVKVKGDCEFTFNRVDDGTWRVCLVNNLGSVKDPKSSEEKLLDEWAQDVTLTLPKGAKAEEIRLGVRPRVSGDEWTFKVPPAGVLVVKVDGVKAVSKGDLKDVAEKAYSPVRNFARRFATGRKNDGFKFDPKEPSRWNPQNKTPALVGEWLAKNGFRDTSGSGHDMKVRGKFDERDGAAFAGKNSGSFATTSFKTDYTLYQGTIETWVKPADDKSAFKADKTGGRGRTGGVVFLNGGDVMLYVGDGRWALGTKGGGRRLDIFGPEAKGEWTHLAVAFDRELVRFYVNGQEVISPEGPIRRYFDQGIDAFYNKLDIVYGSLNPGWGFHFRGGMKGLKYYSRCFSPEEVREKAGEQW